MSIAQRLQQLNERIAVAAERAGRSVSDVQIVAVAKMIPCDQIALAIAAGVTRIGENHVQDAIEKRQVIGPQVEWHLVGHLQSNKVRKALQVFDWIHSIDSVSLLERADRVADELDATPHCLVQVNTSGEASKFGAAPTDLRAIVERASECRMLTIEGLMTIGPLTDDTAAIRDSFRRLRELANEVQAWGAPRVTMRHLSMGMTSDFAIAIEEGATMIRIGTAIFGPRPPVQP